ncbi:DUF1178 family protein [Altererythrobacter lutimaris]|uniref:DUF1178 family protein n=1 Tax=Altererythrobacter lutimaris TaxID=2743979 RepID=A0A850H499_9SPHN|nr:DUF1178 family protein [Altererythrobacter lutimaris]NVE93987.1 DUF1178 family protein [Altererythrobacter lutimaris]
MIVFDLSCAAGHRFEGWFGSSSDYEDQRARGLVACPHCGTADVNKAPMAPAVPAKGNQDRAPAPIEVDSETSAPSSASAANPMTGGEIPPAVQKAMQALADAQAKALKESRYVGDSLADEARAMHYGEKDLEAIHGKATLKEAKELLEEGVPVAPLLAPYTPPDELN